MVAVASLRVQLAVFSGLLFFRLLNGFLLQTFFQPDEYFQSLEPAWQWTFGQPSGAWITWEWKENLRSSLHPLLFSVAYKAADLLCRVISIDNGSRASVLVATPRLLQAFFAAVMDLYTWRLATKVYGHSSTHWTALAVTVLSPWQWFCSVRTFSNSIEASLTAVALDFFPWAWFWESKTTEYDDHSAYMQMQVALVSAAIACILRPTNILIWATISACLALRNNMFSKTFTLLECAVLCGGAVLAVTAAMDNMFYGEWTFPAYRFLYFNLVQSLSVFYGRNRVDYYLTEGLPLLLTTALPFALVALWQAIRQKIVDSHQPAPHVNSDIRFVFAAAVLSPILALTAIAHKEVRFIYPLLPILHVLAAGPIKLFFDQSPFATQRRRIPIGSKARLLILALLISANIFIANYVSRVHQRGVVDVVHYLREKQTTRMELAVKYNISSAASADMTVAFLMPCHSTPWRSHLVHPQIDAWALTCEPPLDVKPAFRASYLDEADQFYADPVGWIDTHMRSRYTIAETVDRDVQWDKMASLKLRKWPNYLVFFEQLEPVMQQILNGSMYHEVERFFNTHWIDDSRRRGDVIVYALKFAP